MKAPGKMTEESCRTLILQMVTQVPPEMTLAAMIDPVIETLAAISDRIEMEEMSTLIGAMAVITKACAADEHLANRKIKIDKGTVQ